MTHVLAYLRPAFYRTSDTDSRPSLSINKSSLMSQVLPGFSAHSTTAVHNVQ